ncbi:hypothetical protein M513_06442 [Trichuris suis]|uniref:Uncharacterized protein n=1 Tax=Trichuris suis TaxID=68888 RepID=A0A085M5U9_9BILA|nr:hypothetical protein M513_06442 [Trichuris suis]
MNASLLVSNDILTMEVLHWVVDPFSSVDDAEVKDQEELVKLQCNEELKPNFKSGCQTFWSQKKIPSLYLSSTMGYCEKPLVAFPSSYLIERRFSIMADILSEKRNRSQIAERDEPAETTPNYHRLSGVHKTESRENSNPQGFDESV